jgi:hypothetical protein
MKSLELTRQVLADIARAPTEAEPSIRKAIVEARAHGAALVLYLLKANAKPGESVMKKLYALIEHALELDDTMPSSSLAVARGERVATEEQLEKLGRLVDRIDNLVHAGAIPMRDELRVKALTASLPDLHSELKALYIEIAGDDPWADPPSSEPPR